MDKESKAYKSGEFDDMFEAAKLGNLAAEEMVAYRESKQRYNDMKLYYQYSFAKGEQEGYNSGFEKGIENERINSIRMMASLGIPPTVIAENYGMPLDHVLGIISAE